MRSVCLMRTMAAAGGGQGIGRAFAHALGEAGASVAIVDINAGTAQATAQELNAKGVRSIAVTADITNAKECQRYSASQGSLLIYSSNGAIALQRMGSNRR